MIRRVLGSLVVGLTFGAVGLLPAGPAAATPSRAVLVCDGTWHTTATPVNKRHDQRFYGVAAVSATDAWAVGTDIDGHNVSKPIIERWDGSTWTAVSSPLPAGATGGGLNAVTVISATDAWAVGQYTTASFDHLALIERWNGTAWAPVSSGLLGNDVNASGVDAVSATDIWLVGDKGINTTGSWSTFTAHWNGTTWSAVPSPNKSGSVDDLLHAVSATSSGDVWASGGYTDTISFHGLVEHWNGSAWSVVKSPTTAFFLNGLVAVSPTDAWAAGSDTSGNVLETDRWNGTKWASVANVPLPGEEPDGNAMAASSATDVWMIGSTYPESAQRVPLAEHWNGFGWTRVTADFPVAESLDMHGASVTADGATAFSVGNYAKPAKKAQTLAQIWC